MTKPLPLLPRRVQPTVEFIPLHAAIVFRARELWIEFGRPRNNDVAIWLEAQGQLVAGTLDFIGQRA